MKPTDLKPGTVCRIEITGNFVSMEMAVKFPGINPNDIKIGAPPIREGELLGTDEWGRYVITHMIVPEHDTLQ
jgi:hypothetical protein